MTRILALVALLFAGNAWAQEPIVLEKIGAVRMALPDELQRHYNRAEMSARPDVSPLDGATPMPGATEGAARGAGEEPGGH
jgi:hypothetical protein